MFRVQLYKNNARALLSRILSILNLDWLQHARSVRGVYELNLLTYQCVSVSIYILQGSGRRRTTSSTSTTPPPSPSPSSVTTPLKWSAAPPQPDPKVKAEREAKAAKARKAREEARRRLIAAKRAARQRVKSVDKPEAEAAVEIFVPETSWD